MRYADCAYQHIKENNADPNRAIVMDRRAREAGFENTADYIDHLQGKQDTRSFEGADNRVCWVNEGERVYGWNNRNEPENSTVIPARKAGNEFENHKNNEAKQLGVKELQEQGPLSDQDRTVDPHRLKQETTQQAVQPEAQVSDTQASVNPEERAAAKWQALAPPEKQGETQAGNVPRKDDPESQLER